MFFILELPSKLDDEKRIQSEVITNLHKDVYYIDECSQEEALTILSRVGKLLLNDGLCGFGVGGHLSNNEIMIGKYNLVYVYEKEQGFFSDFFEVHNIQPVEQLLTAWDKFLQEYPGEAKRVITDVCIDYQSQSKEFFTYNDWLFLLE